MMSRRIPSGPAERAIEIRVRQPRSQANVFDGLIGTIFGRHDLDF